MTRKPLPCKFGFHRWFVDAAIANSALICNGCGKADNPKDVKALQDERERIMALPKGASIAKVYMAAYGIIDPALLDEVEEV